MSRCNITTHILDTSRGKPAARVKVKLEKEQAFTWETAASGETDSDGRLATLTPGGISPGHYRLSAAFGAWFARQGVDALYGSAIVDFFVLEGQEHLHLPLLISPYGWSTYRGS
ncbi:hydroxyisourate hydrolase [Enterobacteriales bacterium SAP-6]|uniref:5-hydroxyisourate hydrolase n=2 Tax=Acerihabitans arboris TaxID=2691583 RepID=A0A845SPN3_9GAMM|nr:hydroxyisourate hydrolase [Acerihabitans arboris]